MIHAFNLQSTSTSCDILFVFVVLGGLNGSKLGGARNLTKMVGNHRISKSDSSGYIEMNRIGGCSLSFWRRIPRGFHEANAHTHVVVAPSISTCCNGSIYTASSHKYPREITILIASVPVIPMKSGEASLYRKPMDCHGIGHRRRHGLNGHCGLDMMATLKMKG